MTQHDRTETSDATDGTAIRDRIVEATLTHVPFDGWSRTALRHAAADLDMPFAEAAAYFPNTARDLVSWHSRMADRHMLDALTSMDLEALKIRERIATGVMTRLEQNAAHKDAVRKALSVLALPRNSALSLQLLYHTVDDIWFAAGDRSTDWNFYTKRMLLGAVYSSTILYWLDDNSEGMADTRAFLDRRIANVMQVPKLTSKLGKLAGALPRRANAIRRFRTGTARRAC